MNGSTAYMMLKDNTVSGGGVPTDASQLTTGTLNDARLSSNITKQGNTFNGANQLVKNDASGKIPAANIPITAANMVVVPNEAARLALPQSTNLMFALQADTQIKWGINANLNPATASNWINNGSFASSVVSVNGATGAITIDLASLGGVPTARTVNGKALSSNITLSLGDIITLNGDANSYIGGDGNLHQLSSAIATNDKASSGYFDIGAMRMQWGKSTSVASGSVTVTLPAPFANNTYNVTANSNNDASTAGIMITIRSGSRTTTSFVAYKTYSNPGAFGQAGETFEWFAIGLKP